VSIAVKLGTLYGVVKSLKSLRAAGYLTERETARKLARVRAEARGLGYAMVEDEFAATFQRDPKGRRA